MRTPQIILKLCTVFIQIATTPLPAVDKAVCPKCGANKSGRRSCCAPGGAWAGKCGNDNDSKFDHTWTEGIQACKSQQASRQRSGEAHTVFATDADMKISANVNSSDGKKFNILLGFVLMFLFF